MTNQVMRLKERLNRVASGQARDVAALAADAAPKQPEKRLAPRKLSNLPGYLKIDGRNRMINCMVLDMSATGACIMVLHGDKHIKEDIVRFPDYLTLFITYDKVSIECKIVWRREDVDQIGVRFQSPAKSYS